MKTFSDFIIILNRVGWGRFPINSFLYMAVSEERTLRLNFFIEDCCEKIQVRHTNFWVFLRRIKVIAKSYIEMNELATGSEARKRRSNFSKTHTHKRSIGTPHGRSFDLSRVVEAW